MMMMIILEMMMMVLQKYYGALPEHRLIHLSLQVVYSDLVLSACNPVLEYMIFPVGPANFKKKNAAEYVFIKQGKLKKIINVKNMQTWKPTLRKKNKNQDIHNYQKVKMS